MNIKTLKNLATSKTVIFSLLTMVLGALQAAQTLNLNPTQMGYVTLAVGVIGFLIRLVTNKPVIDTFQG